MRTLAFASALTSPHPTNPWLLLREERHDAGSLFRFCPCGQLLQKTDPFTPCQIVTNQFQGLFNTPPGVLFNFRSHYSFAIGLGCLFSVGGICPPYSCPRSSGHYSFGFLLFCIAHEAITLYGLSFQKVVLAKKVVHPTSAPCHQGCIRYALFGFQSPLLAISHLMSFPAGIRMF
jgi:hypothetical protein